MKLEPKKFKKLYPSGAYGTDSNSTPKVSKILQHKLEKWKYFD